MTTVSTSNLAAGEPVDVLLVLAVDVSRDRQVASLAAARCAATAPSAREAAPSSTRSAPSDKAVA